jgi:hypothetical protein
MQDKKKKNIKVRDLKPSKDAKGGGPGHSPTGPGHTPFGPGHSPTGPGHSPTGPTGGK